MVNNLLVITTDRQSRKIHLRHVINSGFRLRNSGASADLPSMARNHASNQVPEPLEGVPPDARSLSRRVRHTLLQRARKTTGVTLGNHQCRGTRLEPGGTAPILGSRKKASADDPQVPGLATKVRPCRSLLLQAARVAIPVLDGRYGRRYPADKPDRWRFVNSSPERDCHTPRGQDWRELFDLPSGHVGQPEWAGRP